MVEIKSKKETAITKIREVMDEWEEDCKTGELSFSIYMRDGGVSNIEIKTCIKLFINNFT